MKIFVTQEHIDNGIRLEGNACPVALALMEATGLYREDIDIDRSRILAGSYRFKSPPSVSEFVDKFDGEADCENNCEPFEFEIPDMGGLTNEK